MSLLLLLVGGVGGGGRHRVPIAVVVVLVSVFAKKQLGSSVIGGLRSRGFRGS